MVWLISLVTGYGSRLGIGSCTMTEPLPVPDPPPGADLEVWNSIPPEVHAEAAPVARNLMNLPPKLKASKDGEPAEASI